MKTPQQVLLKINKKTLWIHLCIKYTLFSLQKGIENRIASLETDTATEIQRSKNKINSLGE
jgi:hypothetical protein